MSSQNHVYELQIRRALAELYEPEGVEVWLHSPHKMLDGQRAIDLIRGGSAERVWQVVNTMITGAFG